jgi:hypothetical protein
MVGRTPFSAKWIDPLYGRSNGIQLVVFQYVAAFNRNIIDEYRRQLRKNLDQPLIDSFEALFKFFQTTGPVLMRKIKLAGRL